MTRRTALTALVLTGLLVAPLRAQPQPLKATNEWRGSVADLTLQGQGPASGAITTQKALDELWKAWKVGDQAPKLDFTKEIALVATSRGSRLTLSAQLDDKGDLQSRAISTRDLRPGFRFHIITVSRNGVKTLNGKKLTQE